MSSNDRHCIVLAWLVDDTEVVRYRRTDLGEHPVLRTVRRPRAVTWVLAGTEEDEATARAYAAERGEGMRVYCYPEGEADPLGRARAEREGEGKVRALKIILA